MGVNFSAFEIGRRALRANQLGIAVTGNNIANVNTTGYSRQSVQLSPIPGDSFTRTATGGGVSIDGLKSFRDRFIESRFHTETAIAGRLTAQRDALAPVDAALNETGGGGLRSAMAGFFGAFAELEANPTSAPLRAAVAGRAEALANAFSTTRSRLAEIQTSADEALRAGAEQANSLASEVAALNARIGQAEATGADASALRDRRGEAVRQLAELAGARSIETENGSITLTLGDGRALVVGDKAFRLEAVSTPPEGFTTLTLEGSDAVVSDGRLRGLIDARNTIGSHIAALDDLASSVAERVNALHTAGADADGRAGLPLFVSSDGATVTAATLRLNDAVRADPRLVVAGAQGEGSGDGSVARAISNLLDETRSSAGSRSGSFNEIFASIVRDAGASLRSVEDSLATQQAVLAQTHAQRESVSGVSLDEEAINLLQYQKAYEAAARFLRIADEMTQTILAIGQ